MLAMLFSNSMAMTGKVVLLRFVRIDLQVLVVQEASVAVVVVVVVVDLAVHVAALVEASVLVVDSWEAVAVLVVGQASEVVEVASEVATGDLQLEVLRMLLLLSPIPSQTMPLLVLKEAR